MNGKVELINCHFHILWFRVLHLFFSCSFSLMVASTTPEGYANAITEARNKHWILKMVFVILPNNIVLLRIRS